MRVYFGGSFNPPHVGHDQILKALLKVPEVEFVHVVPTSQNPLKTAAPDEMGFGFEDRYLLAKAWMQSLSSLEKNRVVLEEEEIKKARAAGHEVPQFTIDTLSILRQRNSGASWSLAMGADLLPGLPRWKNVGELLKSLQSVFVFERVGEKFQAIPDSLSGLTSFRRMKDPILEVSSTALRKDLEGFSQAENGALLPLVRSEILGLLGPLS
jgi:nicotinate-nucleotide adenylyltransferase